MKYKLRTIIAIFFIGLGVFFIISQSQIENISDKSDVKVDESNSKLMRKLDPEFDKMMTDLEELENQINEESGINQLNREMDELMNQINEESGINQLNRELDAMTKELEELFIID